MLRLQQLNAWLAQVLEGETYTLAPASADASFRRYFRLTFSDRTLIAMDAPPAQEDCRPFVHASGILAQAGLNVPRVLQQELELGFLLLTDLGNDTYLSVLNASALIHTEADQANSPAANYAADLYRDASLALLTMQKASRPGVFPAYDEALLSREMQLFADWYVNKHLNIQLSPAQQATLNASFALLNTNVLAQGQVFVHRDYHSRNLMVCPGAGMNPGVLDFQDAVYGPISYDLVSLLKDAYIVWKEDQVLDWVVRYWQLAKKEGLPVPADIADFYRDFEWMGAQRHLKILGIFARLYHRDGKDGYLKDMPLVMQYLRRVCARYIELRPLLRLLDELEGRPVQAGYTF